MLVLCFNDCVFLTKITLNLTDRSISVRLHYFQFMAAKLKVLNFFVLFWVGNISITGPLLICAVFNADDRR